MTEKQDYVGRSAIRDWIDSTTRKLRFTATPDRDRSPGDATIVTAWWREASGQSRRAALPFRGKRDGIVDWRSLMRPNSRASAALVTGVPWHG